jgi:hypothetical protein
VEAGLQQIGMNAEEAEQVAQRLIGVQTPAPVEPVTAAVETAPMDATPTEPTADFVAESVVEQAPPTPASTAPIEAPVPSVPTSLVAKPRPTAIPHTVDAPSATDLAIRLKQRQRLGEQRSQETAPATHAAVVPPLGLREARIHNRLRQLPFGSWFEFTHPMTGETTQRKLAWFSPVSGNSLFVNRRGQRSDVMNLQELARAIANGHVRELPPQDVNLFDRAWHALTTSLLRSASPLPEAR